jgi:hypothetical protein
LLSCAVAADPVPAPTDGEDADAYVVYEGSEVDALLASAGGADSPVEFVRLGVSWSAADQSNLELSTSADGTTWSDWSPVEIDHTELETEASFIGRFEPSEAANYYRFRAGGIAPSFLKIDFFDRRMSEDIEGGDNDHEGDKGDVVATRFAKGNITVNSRASWGARGARCSSTHSPKKVTIHHTVTSNNSKSSVPAQLRNIQQYHQNVRGWCDIGYHFLVSKDGQLWEGRPVERVGAHVGRHNTSNVGIAFLGTHSDLAPNEVQLAAVAALIADLSARYGFDIKGTTILGHRDQKRTNCPGDALFRLIPSVIQMAEEGGTAPVPEVTDGVAVRGVAYEGAISQRIAGATIRLNGEEIVSDDNGFWEFTNVPEGTHFIEASAPGYRDSRRSVYAIGTQTWASIALQPEEVMGTAKLIGVAYYGSSGDNRIPFANISLSTGQSGQADENGYFEFSNLPAGLVTVTGSDLTYGDGETHRTLVEGETTWGSVKLE